MKKFKKHLIVPVILSTMLIGCAQPEETSVVNINFEKIAYVADLQGKEIHQTCPVPKDMSPDEKVIIDAAVTVPDGDIMTGKYTVSYPEVSDIERLLAKGKKINDDSKAYEVDKEIRAARYDDYTLDNYLGKGVVKQENELSEADSDAFEKMTSGVMELSKELGGDSLLWSRQLTVIDNTHHLAMIKLAATLDGVPIICENSDFPGEWDFVKDAYEVCEEGFTGIVHHGIFHIDKEESVNVISLENALKIFESSVKEGQIRIMYDYEKKETESIHEIRLAYYINPEENAFGPVWCFVSDNEVNKRVICCINALDGMLMN